MVKSYVTISIPNFEESANEYKLICWLIMKRLATHESELSFRLKTEFQSMILSRVNVLNVYNIDISNNHFIAIPLKTFCKYWSVRIVEISTNKKSRPMTLSEFTEIMNDSESINSDFESGRLTLEFELTDKAYAKIKMINPDKLTKLSKRINSRSAKYIYIREKIVYVLSKFVRVVTKQ